MSLPKEPRQKMINVMYLVLTALLALNVSKEILNAFQIVDSSLQNSTGITVSSTGQIMSSFEEKKKDASSRVKAEEWAPKAQSAIDLCQKAYADIDAAKKDLLKLKDTAQSKDNLDASSNLFITQKRGEALHDKMMQLQKDLFAIDPEIAKEFANSLPINIAKNDPDKSKWALKSFNMMPTVASLTILSKLQNDIKASENKIAAYCHSKVGQVVVKYDAFAALVGQSSSYLMPGEKIKITGGLGAFSSNNTPKVSINGQSVAVTNGQGSAEFDAGGTGAHTANVTVSFTDQDGKPQTKTETVSWTVGSPGGAAVMLDKMNVLYIGVDNPVTIASGKGWDKTTVSMSGGSLSGSTGKYTARVSSEGTATINVSMEGKTSAFQFRVKTLPPPTVYCGTSNGGDMQSSSFRAMGGLRAQLENSEFDAPFRVVSYTVTGSGAGFKDGAVSGANTGNFWSGQAAVIAGKAVPGSIISFTNVLIVGPDGKTRKPNNPSFSIRCI